MCNLSLILVESFILVERGEEHALGRMPQSKGDAPSKMMIARRPMHDKHASVPEVTFFATVCNLCIRVHSGITLLCHRPLCRVDRAGRESE